MDNLRYMDVARKMDLFVLGPAPGAVFWKPNGAALYENLRNFILKSHQEHGYQQVKSPQLVEASLFERSGHNDKYRENIFVVEHGQDNDHGKQEIALRPMSCPNHIMIYQSQVQSWRDLPVKLFEFGEVFRNESSGSLQVLFRQKQFCQDDSHVFAKHEDIGLLLQDYLNMSQKIYRQLGFEKIEYAISLRPEKRFGSDALWDKAEQELIQACQAKGLDYELCPGGGAFYGPKIEIKVCDKLGRSWQLGVIQLDYVLPERFGLSYIDANNEKQVPVILHHAVLGSMERMIGIMLEVFAGDIAHFLHPIKAVVLPVSDKHVDYAHKVQQELCRKHGWRLNECPVSKEAGPLNGRIAKHASDLVPHIYVVGKAEEQEYVNHARMKAMLRQANSNSCVEI